VVVRRWVGAALVVDAIVLAGCSGSGSNHCDRSGSAELCVVKKSGHYEIEGKGLKPGSTVAPQINGRAIGDGTRVAADGTLGGGVLGLIGGPAGDLVVTGTARNGDRLRVRLHAE
jgi:hypothetical protein